MSSNHIKIYDEKVKGMCIKNVNIINNIAYIYHSIYNEYTNQKIYRLYLKKINLITGEKNNILLFSDIFDYIYCPKILNNKLYIFTDNCMYIYELDDNLFDYNLNKEQIKNIQNTQNNLINSELQSCIIDKYKKYENITLINKINLKIYNIIIYNNIEYYLIFKDDRYIFININGDILFEFIDRDNKSDKKINYVYINVGIAEDITEIWTCKDKIIFKQFRFIIYNITTKEIDEFEYIDVMSDDAFIYSKDKFLSVETHFKNIIIKNLSKKSKVRIFVYDVNTNKSSHLDDFFHDKIYVRHIYEMKDNSFFKIDNYYLAYNNNDLIIYLHNKINYNNDKLFDAKLIKIGTIDNSQLIKDMYSSINEIDEIIHPSFEYIILYHDFVNGIKVLDLYNLFKICDLLIDKKLEIVGELIIEFIKYNDININESFKYLELFTTNIFDYQLKKIFYIIIKKYNFDDVNNKLNNINKETKLYNFCIYELIKYVNNN